MEPLSTWLFNYIYSHENEAKSTDLFLFFIYDLFLWFVVNKADL